ncbi:MAG: aldehyde dehydrogenase family protein [Planctomycetota bacterium]|jgi:acyl-CoA reductase-like NAD-dependent aldehyde dehydrogenase|nr:aldehyde dehydrogenase family protein [Planctomycetota bacterium]
MTQALKYYLNNQYVESKTEKFYEVYNPSTGELHAKMPRCTTAEVKEAVEAAHKAYPAWSATPPMKRAQVLFNLRNLIETHMDELTMLCAKEHGKNWGESQGDSHFHSETQLPLVVEPVQRLYPKLHLRHSGAGRHAGDHLEGH